MCRRCGDNSDSYFGIYTENILNRDFESIIQIYSKN
jgi:hypothetical protein